MDEWEIEYTTTDGYTSVITVPALSEFMALDVFWTLDIDNAEDAKVVRRISSNNKEE